MWILFRNHKRAIDDTPEIILTARKLERMESNKKLAIEAFFSLIILAVAIGTCHFCK